MSEVISRSSTYADYPHYAQTVGSFINLNRFLGKDQTVINTHNVPPDFISLANHHSPRGLIWEDITTAAIAYDEAQRIAGIAEPERRVLRILGKSTLFNSDFKVDKLVAEQLRIRHLGFLGPKLGKIAYSRTLKATHAITGLQMETLDFDYILDTGLAAIPIDRDRDLSTGEEFNRGRLRRAYQVAEQDNMHIFPEGDVTHPEAGQLSGFERGALNLALKAKKPLLPVAFVYGNTSPLGILGQDLLVDYGEPFELKSTKADLKKPETIDQIRARLQQHVNRARKNFESIYGYSPGEQPKTRVLKNIIFS